MPNLLKPKSGKTELIQTAKLVRRFAILFFLFILFTGSLTPSFGFSPDSLIRILNSDKKYSVRYDAARKLSTSYTRINLDSAQLFIKRGIRILDNSGNDTLKADAYYVLSSLKFYAGQFDSSLFFIKKSNSFYNKKTSPAKRAQNFNVIAAVFSRMGVVDSAYYNYLQAIQLFEKAGDNTGVAKVANNMGALEHGRNNLKEAEQLFRKSFQANSQPNGRLSACISLANVFLDGNQPDSALLYIRRGIPHAVSTEKNVHLGTLYRFLADVWSRKNRRDSTAYYSEKSLKIIRKTQSPRDLYETLIKLAEVGQRVNKAPEKIKSYLDEALGLAEKGTVTFVETYALHLYYSAYFESVKVFDSAFHHSKICLTVKDSLHKMEHENVTEQMKTAFDTEKKEQQIALLNKDQALKEAELNEQNRLILFGAAVLFIVAVLLLIVFRNSLRRKKDNAEILNQKKEILTQNQELQQQREEILSINNKLEAQKNELIDKHRALTGSVRYAKSIQSAVLPSEDRFRSTFNDYFLIYKPKQIVSGDFYWLEQRGNYTFLAVADCTGHGVPGAFMSMLGSSFLIEIIDRENVREPSHILERLDKKVRAHLNQDDGRNSDGMDLSLCRIEKKGDEFEVLFSGVKSSLLYIKDGTLKRVRGSSGTIGGNRAFSKKKEQHRFIMPEESILILSTDGFTDQLSPERKRFSTKHFLEVIEQNIGSSLPELKSDLKNTLEAHRRGMEQIDDICVLCVKL